MTLDEMSKLRKAARAVIDARDNYEYEKMVWERLAQCQPFADAHGFGSEWARMLEERTEDTVWEAAYAAEQAAEVAWVPVSEAVWASFPEPREDDAALDAAAEATYLAEDMVELAGRAWAALRAAEGKNND
jgi:hypothetical protein